MNKKTAEKKPHTKRRDSNSLSASSETTAEPNSRISPIDQIHFHEQFKCKNDAQKKLVQSIKINDVTMCSGPAGTGKSICSVYMALKLLKEQNDKYKTIICLKSITQLRDETLASIPGTAMEKMYFQNLSFIDAFTDLIDSKTIGDLINESIIKFDVIGSMRGRNLSNCIIILDECQNISYDNLKTILTRLSNNAKIIILGDPKQVDIRNKKDSSFAPIMLKIKNKPINGVDIVEFNKTDIVRHKLTSYFIDLFENESVIIEKPNKKIEKISLFKKLLVKLF